tara:strand:- start:1326 stop:1844 length:519 start_codon:yes stop_codon:yes gene_type:complete
MVKSLRQRLADLNSYYEDIMEESARRRGDTYDRETGSYKDYGRIESNKHCGGTSCAIRKMFPKSNMTEVLGNVKYKGRYEQHMWNINEKGDIIDASRDQFGDTKGVHVIKPTDKRYHTYTQINPEPVFDRDFSSSPQRRELAEQHIKRQKRRQTRNVNRFNELKLKLSKLIG